MEPTGPDNHAFPADAFLATILEHAAEAVIGLDAGGVVRAWNRGAERLFGFEAREAVGQPVSFLDPPGIAPAAGDRATTRLAKDGRRLRVEIDQVPLDGDRTGRTVLVVRDRTEALRISHEEGQDARLLLLGRVAAQLAHEVRNPLNSVILNASLLEEALADYRRDGRLDIEDAEEALGILFKEVRNLREVTDEFLEFARLPSGRGSTVQANTLVRGLVRFMRREMDVAGVKPVLALDKALPRIKVDALRLKQALLNLVKNAVEAMPQGGRLSIETRLSGDRIEIAVSDTGPGVDPDQVEFIFHPFFTTKVRGTGLGLAYSRDCVRAEGGDIRHEGAPGCGATFVVSLPAPTGRVQ